MGKLEFLLAVLIASVVGEAVAGHVQFAEPFSGARVNSYEVRLPVDRDKHETVHVPADCAGAVRNWYAAGAQWGSMIERHLWAKVMGDCRYHALLHGQRGDGATQDFVSSYDFLNARLLDLPLGLGCAMPGAPCSHVPSGMPRLGELIQVDPGIAIRSVDGGCRIIDGVFRGRIRVEGDALVCAPDPLDPGFRIIAVHFADVNHDGFEDAVLRLVPLGPGHGRTPILLPLTRLGEHQPFTIADGVPLEPSGPGR